MIGLVQVNQKKKALKFDKWVSIIICCRLS